MVGVIKSNAAEIELWIGNKEERIKVVSYNSNSMPAATTFKIKINNGFQQKIIFAAP